MTESGMSQPDGTIASVTNEVIHPEYLPYAPTELAEHMPPVGVMREERADGWLRHFVESAENERRFRSEHPDPRGLSATQVRRALQVDKDERFWIAAAIMRLARPDDASERLATVLSSVYGEIPPVGTSWESLLDGTIHLYLEAALPSPPAYKAWLADNVDRHPVRYVRSAARKRGSDGIRPNLEARTNVDALVVVPETGFGLVVEAKVLSDVASYVTFDPARNQIARNVDVMLEHNRDLPSPMSMRAPDRSFFLLITPQLFMDHPTSRLYGWLMGEYRRDASALARDLPHRGAAELDGLERRLGWTSWEQVARLYPDACPWITTMED